MARKKHAKHSKNTVLASSSARHPFSKFSASAATAVVGASLALSVTPALAQENAPANQGSPKEATPVVEKKNQETLKASTPAPTTTSSTNSTSGGGRSKF